MPAARVSSPAGITGHGLLGCATDGIRSAALVSMQETEPEVEDRKERLRLYLLAPSVWDALKYINDDM